jgi:thiol-disulfide isomerase/thioredoxin
MRLAFAALLALASAPLASAVDVAPAPREKAAVDPNPKEAPKLRLPGEAGVGRLVPDVAFTDPAGKPGKLSDFKKSELLVVAFTNTTCPVCKKYAPSLQRIEKEFAAKGVSFLYVNPTRTDTPADHGFAGRYVHDKDGTLTAAFGATSTAEVFVLDAARTVRYRGATDDQYGLGYALNAPRFNYLTVALTDLLAGKNPVVQATTAPGCELSLPVAAPRAAELTYHARVERIMQANCVECHRKGGVAPFALGTYDDVVAHKGMIKKTVDKGTMPPWFAAPPKKGEHSPFVNDRTLTESDKKDLFAWLAGDMKKGDAADAPLPRKYESGWLIGKPDAVFEIPKPVAVKAEGVMPYQNTSVPTNYDEDRWVQAVEVQPTARDVVHHVLIFALRKGQRNLAGGEAAGFFAAYVPGNNNLIYPEGYAKKLPKGATLHFQIHYTPNGKATSDQTRLGVIFAKEKPRYEVHVSGLANPVFAIPPGAGNHKVVATAPNIPFEGRLLAVFPHAHLRGKAAQYSVKTPDGKSTTILDVPHYDFNWQLQYRFAEPVKLPKGSSISYTAWYDNSDKNPANPDPKKRVRWGPQTYDEMHLGYVEFVVDSGNYNGAPLALAGILGGDLSNFKFPKEGVEIPAQAKDFLKQYDKNGDGRIDEKEFEAMPQAVKRVITIYVERTRE